MDLTQLTDKELSDLKTEIEIELAVRQFQSYCPSLDREYLVRMAAVVHGPHLSIGDGWGVVTAAGRNVSDALADMTYTVWDEPTAPNPFPMYGKDPNEVFNKKKRRKR